MNQYTIELQNRTRNLATSLFKIIKTVKIDLLNKNIISQLLRSITSIGANYNEALESESKDDFIHKLSICKKETSETIYWLQLLLETNQDISNKLLFIQIESNELLKIFASSIATTKRNKSK